MKTVALTQRVTIDPRTHERRDCIDQRWAALVGALGALPIVLPNIAPALADQLLEKLQPALIVLTGGNTLSGLVQPPAPDEAPERDAFEHALVAAALKRGLQVLGVCRGLQLLNVHFGGALRPVQSHAGSRHAIDLANGGERVVNSYHDWGIGLDDVAACLEPMAFDKHGGIEALAARGLPVRGVMWHPERESPLDPQDIELFRMMLWPEP